MQEALQNPHYKKIWEKVIRSRHPEIKTLKYALTREKAYFDCLFMYNNIISYIGEQEVNLIKCITSYKQMPKEHSFQLTKSEYRQFWLEYTQEVKILGRPITFEDILLYYNLDYYAGAIVEFYTKCGYIEPYEICSWQLTKPLHEQSPKTWEEISNYKYK